ncbi:MAG TPA: cation diffusion facilitator family transporter [bacterium]|nr:cation diffusion facilitator family transporter [bacterium]
MALSSVAAAALLTALKAAVGVLTGSLGILSEAAHSALDLVAAVITYTSVRVADQPADPEHPFGHGKVEHLSAFVQTALLAVTSVWIVVEALRRLFLSGSHVAPSLWAFAVLALSIVIDTFRSRALGRVAAQYRSQALEADALHFSTDVWSTSAVVLGLVLVSLGATTRLPWLAGADPIAALVVAGVTLYVGTRLGNRTVGALMDAAPEGVPERLAQAASRVPGVLDVERVRARQSGNRLFADLRLVLESNIPLEHAQSVVGRVEDAIREVYPAADVIADAVPHVPAARDVVQRVRSVAHRENFQIHDVTVFETRGRMKVDLDLEVDPNIRFTEAHDQATDLERTVRGAVPEIDEVNVHIEPLPRRVERAREATQARAKVERRMVEIARGLAGVVDCHSVEVHQIGRSLLATVHCTLQPDLSVTRVHDITEELELRVREEFREGIRVSIHPEPAGGVEPAAPGA